MNLNPLEILKSQSYQITPSDKNPDKNPDKTPKKKLSKVSKRTSNFFIMLNSQRSVKTMRKEESDLFIASFRAMVRQFLHKDVWDFLIVTQSKSINEKISNMPLEQRITVYKDPEFVVEIGKEKGHIHAHMILWMSHIGSNVKLDYRKIWDYWKDKLDHCFLSFKVFRDTNFSLQAYISKTSDDPNFKV